jgi:hypothetical protein
MNMGGKMPESWIDRKYTTERIAFRVEVDVSYRIKKHRTVLVSKIKKDLKQLPNNHNNNVLVVKKVSEINV